jgi:hypothetical protein
MGVIFDISGIGAGITGFSRGGDTREEFFVYRDRFTGNGGFIGLLVPGKRGEYPECAGICELPGERGYEPGRSPDSWSVRSACRILFRNNPPLF